jgi:hypothetical protein
MQFEGTTKYLDISKNQYLYKSCFSANAQITSIATENMLRKSNSFTTQKMILIASICISGHKFGRL